jgi:putative hydrolase of the HAD superfamily
MRVVDPFDSQIRGRILVAASRYANRVMVELLVVFDGDDTLWISEPLYDQARSRARKLVEQAGFDGERWETLERAIDMKNVPEYGLSAERFPNSCVQAYEALLLETNRPPNASVKETIWEAANSVFQHPAELVPGVHDVLDELARIATLALLTQGDSRVQRRRLDQTDLTDFFDAVHGVEQKTKASFRRIMSKFAAKPDNSWSIGNSLASDINPALSLGMNAIWIPQHVWEYEQRETTPVPGRLFVSNSLTEVPRLILSARGGHAAAQ